MDRAQGSADEKVGGVAPRGKGSRFALTGLAFSALFLIAWFLVHGSPTYLATDAELTSYYGDDGNRRTAELVGLYVIPLAGIFFIWFMAALRDRYHRIARREHAMLSSVQVVAGALVVTSLFTVAAVELAVAWLADTSGAFDVDGVRSLLAVGEATSEIMALRSAAVFVLVSTARAKRAGFFPRPFAAASILTAVALLVVHQAIPWVTVLFPAWVASVSLLILLRRDAGTPIDEA
jgi:hypothetical protein